MITIQILEQYILDNLWVIIPLLIWSLAWKGFALWKAARLTDRWWFGALLIVNTIGLLDIIYIFVISKRKGPSDGQ